MLSLQSDMHDSSLIATKYHSLRHSFSTKIAVFTPSIIFVADLGQYYNDDTAHLIVSFCLFIFEGIQFVGN